MINYPKVEYLKAEIIKDTKNIHYRNFEWKRYLSST